MQYFVLENIVSIFGPMSFIFIHKYIALKRQVIHAKAIVLVQLTEDRSKRVRLEWPMCSCKRFQTCDYMHITIYNMYRVSY